MLLFSSGCATIAPEPAASAGRGPASPQAPLTAPGQEGTDLPVEPALPAQPEKHSQPAPQTIASLRLTDQARLLIEAKKPDDAIRILERALNIDPGNGQNYYYLAEAWLQKNNRRQAVEFNRMAGLYLNMDSDWMSKVRRQKNRIEAIPK